MSGKGKERAEPPDQAEKILQLFEERVDRLKEEEKEAEARLDDLTERLLALPEGGSDKKAEILQRAYEFAERKLKRIQDQIEQMAPVLTARLCTAIGASREERGDEGSASVKRAAAETRAAPIDLEGEGRGDPPAASSAAGPDQVLPQPAATPAVPAPSLAEMRAAVKEAVEALIQSSHIADRDSIITVMQNFIGAIDAHPLDYSGSILLDASVKHGEVMNGINTVVAWLKRFYAAKEQSAVVVACRCLARLLSAEHLHDHEKELRELRIIPLIVEAMNKWARNVVKVQIEYPTILGSLARISKSLALDVVRCGSIPAIVGAMVRLSGNSDVVFNGLNGLGWIALENPHAGPAIIRENGVEVILHAMEQYGSPRVQAKACGALVAILAAKKDVNVFLASRLCRCTLIALQRHPQERGVCTLACLLLDRLCQWMGGGIRDVLEEMNAPLLIEIARQHHPEHATQALSDAIQSVISQEPPPKRRKR